MSSIPPPETAAPPPPPPAPPVLDDVPPTWPLWIAPMAVVLGFALGLVGSVIVAVIGAAAGSNLSNPSPAVELAASFVFDVGFVLSALYLVRMNGPVRAVDFGFRRPRLVVGVGAFVLAAVGYYVISAIYASVVHVHGSDKLPNELGVSTSTAALVVATVFVCVVAPIAEEFFFRGFLFGTLRRMRIPVFGTDVGVWVAAIITGILFGIAHTGSASSQFLVPLGFLGFVLCIVRWKTRSLYPCIALHSANNALALGINQLDWSAAAIIALLVGSLLAVGAVTLPLSAPRTA
jgi:membrane protease YdiL (CAAX protease family)